jgi:hypothetical protein
VPTALACFPHSNQLEVLREDVHVTEADLLSIPETAGEITPRGACIRTSRSASAISTPGCKPIQSLLSSRMRATRTPSQPTTIPAATTTPA